MEIQLKERGRRGERERERERDETRRYTRKRDRKKHWTKIEISYMFCFPQCDISPHFLHITSRGLDRATFHTNERNV